VKIAVLCPTRDRPEKFRRLWQSVMDTTSDKSTVVLAYIDDDQIELYREHLPPHGFIAIVGPRVGPVAACNAIVERYHDHFDIFGILTDDCEVTVPGWDKYLAEVMEMFPKRLVVVSPFHNCGDHVDMPFVSKEWIDVVGWYACPDVYHYCWPIVTGLIGEMTAICHCPMQRFALKHDLHERVLMSQAKDAQPFFEFVSLKLPVSVERLRDAMREV
jgi:hypothetical protein